MVLVADCEMNYESNKLARVLKKGKSIDVRVIVPYINRYLFSTVITGIKKELYPKGYNVIICQTHEAEEREIEIINNLLNAQVEGILISLSRFSTKDTHFKQVLRKQIPLIFLDRKKDMPRVSSVTIDDF